MTRYALLGHGNVALSIILDTLLAIYEGKVSVKIIRNLPSGDNEEEKLPFHVPGIEAEVLESNEWVPEIADHCLIAAFQPKAKKAIFEYFLMHHGIRENRYTTLIHPSAIIASTATIGHGSIVGPGSIIAPFASLGNFVSVNRLVTIGHHTSIGDYTTINPAANVAGMIKMGKEVIVGMGSNINDRITIGDSVIVGSASLVTKDLPDGVKAYGIPAKVQGIN